MSFMDDLQDLETAEDFLSFLGIAFDQKVVHVNRLHILQRFHDYMAADTGLADLTGDDALAQCHRTHLQRAYQDFVDSTAVAEKVFEVHKDQAARMSGRFVSLDSLTQ
jgi:nitrogenase-stabilizing/protective protein